MKSNQGALTFISKVLKEKKMYIVILLMLQAMTGIFMVCHAWLIRGAIDAAVEQDKLLFIRFVLLFAGIVVLQLLVRAGIRFLEEYSRSTYENMFKERLFDSLLFGNFAKVTEVHSGEWMNRLTSDTVVVADALATIVPGLVGMSVRILGALGMILYFEPRLVYVLVPGGVLMAFFTYAFRKVLKRLHKRMQEKDGVVRTFLQEYLESQTVVRAFAVEQESINEASEKMVEHRKARMKKNHFSNFCNVGFGSAMQGAYVAGLAYCGYCLLNGAMSYGTLMAILQLISQIQNPFANITGYVPKYYAMLASAERLMEVENYEKQSVEKKSMDEVLAYYNNSFEKIYLDQVDFCYDEDNQVLKDFSLTIAKGEFVAFTGSSGCGKSTVLKLILGFYQPCKGTVSVTSEFQRLFAYVPQGNMLMSGSIRNVVTFAKRRERGNDEKLRQALSIAGCEFVYDLADGIDTELGEHGAGLSEGQMQRISIARAIFSDSPILLLDEATSALDEETERSVLENIRSLTDKTVIIVTHRPAARSICDKEIHFERL